MRYNEADTSRHWDALAAIDFFSVEVLTLAEYHSLPGCVRDALRNHAKSRSLALQLSHARNGCSRLVGNLTDCFDGFLLDGGYLIMDRDPLRIHCSPPASGKC